MSATFLSAETMASEGTRGLSTYLGFLIRPATTNRREYMREKERIDRGNAKEEGESERQKSCRCINAFQMGREMRRRWCLSWTGLVALRSSHKLSRACTHTETAPRADSSFGLSDNPEYCLHGWSLPSKTVLTSSGNVNYSRKPQQLAF